MTDLMIALFRVYDRSVAFESSTYV